MVSRWVYLRRGRPSVPRVSPSVCSALSRHRPRFSTPCLESSNLSSRDVWFRTRVVLSTFVSTWIWQPGHPSLDGLVPPPPLLTVFGPTDLSSQKPSVPSVLSSLVLLWSDPHRRTCRVLLQVPSTWVYAETSSTLLLLRTDHRPC